jgi:hypothetical protein
MVAVIATAYFWMMIFVLERNTIVELVVGGIKIADMGPATEAYRKAFTDAGATVCGHSKNFKKVEMTFSFKLPRKIPLSKVIAEVDKMREDLKGTPDWPE